MGYNKGYGVPRPTCAEQSKNMRKRKFQNKDKIGTIKSEEWFNNKLKKLRMETKIKFKRQCLWGTRIFDFRCYELGICIEIDGGYHKNREKRDLLTDRHCKEVSGILVYRINNYDEDAAEKVINKIKNEKLWLLRRFDMGLNLSKNKLEKALKIVGIEKLKEYNKKNTLVNSILLRKRKGI